MKIFYMDEETTGKDPVKHDIIQLAAIVEIDGKVMERFNMNCQPFDYSTVEQEALDVNGMTIEKLRTFPEPIELYHALTRMTSKYIDKYDRTDKFTPAGQRVGFDADFLKAFFDKCGDKYFGSWFNWRHVDLLSAVRWLRYAGVLNIENDKLETIAAHFGIQFDAHDAMADIETTRTILHMIRDKYIVGGRHE
jgi:DNA polymerase-3 subunit epsilon